MIGRAAALKVPDHLATRLELAAAAGRERILDAHVDHAAELIERARGEVSIPRAMGIYARLHHVSEAEIAAVRDRVLAVLEARAGVEPAGGEREDVYRWEDRPGLWTRIRRRMKGRVNHRLRRWVELHTGRTEVELFKVHVDNALRFIEVLEDQSTYSEAVRLYAAMLNVREGIGEMVYHFALRRLQARPSGGEAGGGPHYGSDGPLPADGSMGSVTRPLHIMANER